MAVQPGEENVATLFGDVHYFYSPEDDRPRHHRFDKGSYVYLFENAGARRARIEIANNPGTDDQDAFEGFLDKTNVRYSYKHSCVVSLTAPDTADPSEWHLPTYDPSNKNKYHYKLHSLDIYFWLPKDAVLFVNGIRRVLPPAQVEVLDEPGPPPAPAMSPVVQQLEKTVISDPKYSEPTASDQKSQSFSPPPISAVSHSEPAAHFAPMTYNPAAPAAPESIRHREKTPPPDDDVVNPLAAAMAVDYQQQPFSPGFAPPPGHPGVASPGLPPSGYGTHPGLQRAATIPAHGLASPGLTSPYGSAFPGSPGFAPPQHGQMGRPTPPVTSSGLPGPPPPPPGGYSQYNYNTQQGAGAPRQEYNVHNQVYRPTEGEAVEKFNRKKLEEQAGRFERGVGGMLKKFEKKFG